MLAKNAKSSLSGPSCRLIRQPINLETEFAKASQGPADESIVRAFSITVYGLLSMVQVEIKLSVLLFKQYSSQLQKNCVCKAFDHERYQPGMNLRIPPAFGQNLSV